MSEPKTKATEASVDDFIDALKSEQQRDDARSVCKMMQSVAKKKPVLWGTSIIGFGTYPMVYASGKTLDWPILAFSPRKDKTTIYLTGDFDGKSALLKKLGKHKMSGGCLHFKSLDDLHVPTLKALLNGTYKYMKKKYRN